MKKTYFLVLALFVVAITQAQIVNIPDANFKAALLAHSPVVNTNGDGEIQVSEANSFTGNLNVANKNIIDLTGIEKFILMTGLNVSGNNLANFNITQNVNLTFLQCINNGFTSLDVTQNVNLVQLFCGDNSFVNLDISQNVALVDFDCRNNQLVDLYLDENINMESLNCTNNQLISLDLSENINMGGDVDCSNNPLNSLFFKNGVGNDLFTFFGSIPNLRYICVDSDELVAIQNKVTNYGYNNCVVNSYCSFKPGGDFYSLDGTVKVDWNNNGCDAMDLVYPNVKFNITDGVNTGYLISDNTGNYNINVQEGTHTITPQLEDLAYYTVVPLTKVVSFPSSTSPSIQNFCIVPSGVYNDLEATILPLTAATPGFDAEYQIIYKNKGNTTLSGSLDFTFNDDVQDFVSAIPAPDTQVTGIISFNYTNLLPFEMRVVNVIMNINTPTDISFPVNGGDLLSFIATIKPVIGDETPVDNVFPLRQTAVNSYDPNDKTCLEGSEIHTTKVGEYVHYLIRFENNGSADAINIVVKDIIDVAKYDVNTLIPQHGSHPFVTRIRDNNTVEFIFENINLPFDDANNDGYVAFKIKTVATLVDGDVFENNAEIYFDYNFPIITNVAQTTVMSILAISDYEIDATIAMYPNPANEFVKIQSVNNLKEITVIDINGRVLQTVAIIGSQNQKEINISDFSSGIYFVKVVSNKGQQVLKLVKK